MPDLARTLAVLSAVLIAISVAIWAKSLRGPLLQRLDGKRASNAEPAAFAIKLLMAGFGVSVVAVIVAIGGFISA